MDLSKKVSAENDCESTKGIVMQSPAQIDSKLDRHYKIMFAIPIVLTIICLFGDNPLAGALIGGIIDMGYYYAYLNMYLTPPKVKELRNTPYALSRKINSMYELSGIAAKELAYINIIPECKNDEKMVIKYDGTDYIITLDRETNLLYIFPTHSVLRLFLADTNYVKLWKSSCKCVPLIIYTIQKSVKVG